MKFRVHGANPKTGDEFDFDVDADTIQEAEEKAQKAGMLVSRVVPLVEVSKSPPLAAPPSRQPAEQDTAEKVLFTAHPVMFRGSPIQFVLAVGLCLVGIGFLVLLVWWLQCLGTKLTITNERSTLRKGILSKATTEVWHRDIRNVQLKQGPLQRLFDVGSIGISSAGQSGVEIVASGIPKPNKAKDILDHYKRESLAH